MYFSEWEGLRTFRAVAITAVDLAGLIGLMLAMFANRRRYWIVMLYVTTVSLPYALFQPVPRYTYLIYAFLAFGAVEALVRLAAVLPGRRGARRALAGAGCSDIGQPPHLAPAARTVSRIRPARGTARR